MGRVTPAVRPDFGHIAMAWVSDGVLHFVQYSHRNVDMPAIYSSYGGHL
jgi:hypothetical protein